MDRNVFNISKKPIDFDYDGGIDNEAVAVDISGDEVRTVLQGFYDWDRLIYNVGKIGNLSESETDEDDYKLKPTDPEMIEALKEITLDEILRRDMLGGLGAGTISKSYYNLILPNRKNQFVYVSVGNTSQYEVEFNLKVTGDIIANSVYETKVHMLPSIREINYVDIPIPIISNPTIGQYTITATLSHRRKEDRVKEIIVEVEDLSKAELNEELNYIIYNNNKPDPFDNERTEYYLSILSVDLGESIKELYVPTPTIEPTPIIIPTQIPSPPPTPQESTAPSPEPTNTKTPVDYPEPTGEPIQPAKKPINKMLVYSLSVVGLAVIIGIVLVTTARKKNK
jgi:hypothetical protein